MTGTVPDGNSTRVVTERGATSSNEPWPGLLTFRESDKDHFRGRQAETDELRRVVLRERITVLFGLSGLGKSSLLQAGLFPAVRPDRVFPVYARFDFTPAAPDLVQQLRIAIIAQASSHGIEVPAAMAGETLWEFFHRTPNIFWNATNEPVTPLLVLDQFEELFTLGSATPALVAVTDVLVTQLADLVEGRVPSNVKMRVEANPSEAGEFAFARHQYKVLISIREDFLADLETLRVRMPAVGFNRLRLRRMNGAAALMVVNQAPHLIDALVAERVVRFVGADAENVPLQELEIEPALLSVVCRELNTKRAALGEARITADLLEGNQNKVIGEFYERSTIDLPVLRAFIEDRLLTTSGYRDSVALENALATPGITDASIALAVERRLLRREDRGDVPRLELTHDLLISVVKASRDNRKALEAAEERRLLAAHEQAEAEAVLLRTRQEAERQRIEADAAVTSAREEAERQKQISGLKQRQVRVFRIATAVSAFLGVAAIVAAVFAYQKQNEAVRSRVIADSSRVVAEQSLRRFTGRLVEQTRSRDGGLAVSALAQLATGQGADKAVDLLETATLQSNVSIAVMAEVLDTIRSGPSADTAKALRVALLRRMAVVRKIGNAPAREADEAINRRVAIAGGSFPMGSPASSAEFSEKPQHTVTLAAFQMQEHEVTNREYRRFDPTHNVGIADDLPAVDVTWYDATAYAFWLGGMLPAEAQWEYAARGSSGRTFPWGNELPNCTRSNSGNCGIVGLRPVKRDREGGKTPEGIYDLAGNAFEWCRDWYAGYPREAQTNPAGPLTGTLKVVRGGSFNPDAPVVRAAFRSFNRPDIVNHTYGFRVVWSNFPPRE